MSKQSSSFIPSCLAFVVELCCTICSLMPLSHNMQIRYLNYVVTLSHSNNASYCIQFMCQNCDRVTEYWNSDTVKWYWVANIQYATKYAIHCKPQQPWPPLILNSRPCPQHMLMLFFQHQDISSQKSYQSFPIPFSTYRKQECLRTR